MGQRLTEEAFEVLWTAVVGPVRVLQVPHRPLLSGQEVFDLQPGGSVAARLRAEARGDLQATERQRGVPRADPGPVSKALLSPALLQARTDVRHQKEREHLQ